MGTYQFRSYDGEQYDRQVDRVANRVRRRRDTYLPGANRGNLPASLLSRLAVTKRLLRHVAATKPLVYQYIDGVISGSFDNMLASDTQYYTKVINKLKRMIFYSDYVKCIDRFKTLHI